MSGVLILFCLIRHESFNNVDLFATFKHYLVRSGRFAQNRRFCFYIFFGFFETHRFTPAKPPFSYSGTSCRSSECTATYS